MASCHVSISTRMPVASVQRTCAWNGVGVVDPAAVLGAVACRRASVSWKTFARDKCFESDGVWENRVVRLNTSADDGYPTHEPNARAPR